MLLACLSQLGCTFGFCAYATPGRVKAASNNIAEIRIGASSQEGPV